MSLKKFARNVKEWKTSSTKNLRRFALMKNYQLKR